MSKKCTELTREKALASPSSSPDSSTKYPPSTNPHPNPLRQELATKKFKYDLRQLRSRFAGP